MNVPCGTFSSEIIFDGNTAKVMREVDFGLQQVQMSLPAVFTVDLRLNTPRFAKVQDILKAKKKPLEEIMLDGMGIDVTPRLKVEKVEAPTERAGGVIVKDVDELLAKLRNEAKLL
jgi:electron transfer flavoprotein beta subunit